MHDITDIRQQAECLFSFSEVDQQLDRMAHEINQRLGHTNPIILCAMVGGTITTGLLLPKLNFPLQLDYLHATRYGHELEGGQLEWLAYPRLSLKGRTILILDDILDRGITLAESIKYCKNHGAKQVFTGVLADKQIQRADSGLRSADFVAIEVPNRFVIGLGLDYHGYWRNAPGIYAIPD